MDVDLWRWEARAVVIEWVVKGLGRKRIQGKRVESTLQGRNG